MPNNWKRLWIVALLTLSVPALGWSGEPSEKKTQVPFKNSTNETLTFDFSLNDAYAMGGGKPQPLQGVYIVGPKQTVTFELPRKDEMSFRWKRGKKKSDDGGAFLDLKDGKVSVLCYDSSDGIMCGQGGG